MVFPFTLQENRATCVTTWPSVPLFQIVREYLPPEQKIRAESSSNGPECGVPVPLHTKSELRSRQMAIRWSCGLVVSLRTSRRPSSEFQSSNVARPRVKVLLHPVSLRNGNSAGRDYSLRIGTWLMGTRPRTLSRIQAPLVPSGIEGLSFPIIPFTCLRLSLTQLAQRQRCTCASSSAFVRFSSPFHENSVVTQHSTTGLFHHRKNSQGADP